MNPEDFDWGGEVFADGLRIQDRQTDGDPAHHEFYGLDVPEDLTTWIRDPAGFKKMGLALVKACRENDARTASIMSMGQAVWAAERGEDELSAALETMSELYARDGIPGDLG